MVYTLPIDLVNTMNISIPQKRTHNNGNRKILSYKQIEVLKEYQGIFPRRNKFYRCQEKFLN